MASPVAAIYARISDDKTGAGLGVARQEADCRALAESQGFTVHAVYADNDISAYSGKKRPGYQKMLADIAEKRVGVVIAWHNDRLHRNLSELEEYIKISEAAGVTTRTVQSGELDLSTPAGRMTARILGAVSRQESEHKAERIKRKAKELAFAGQYMGGLVPFGWDLIDNVPVINEDQAAVVRQAHAHVLAGFSLNSFIQNLAERGILTAQGNPWSYATLRQMLLRPRNAGLAVYDGEVVGTSTFPALVERHVWEATRSKLTDPSRRRSSSNKVKHLLSGIALCECLRPMKSGQITDRKGVKHMIYRCSESGPGHVNKRMSYVDEHVERQVLVFLAMAAKKAARSPVDPAVVERLKTEEAAHRENLNQAARLFADNLIDGEQLAVMSQLSKAKLVAVQKELAELEAASARTEEVDMPTDVDWSTTAAADLWYGLHVERKRAWIRDNFIVILHRHSRGSARVFDPGTVQIAVRSMGAVQATPAMVEQWKAEAATWEKPMPYGFMIQPVLGPELPSEGLAASA